VERAEDVERTDDLPASQSPPLQGEARDARNRLEQLFGQLPAEDLGRWIQAVSEEIPLSIGADFVNVRLLDLNGLLHLVGASGCSAIEIRKRAFTPLPAESVQRMLENRVHEDHARSLGIPWIHVAWMENDDDFIGTIAVGCRTKRRPSADDLAFLDGLAEKLAEQLAAVDRSGAALRAISVFLARDHGPLVWPTEEEPVAKLRPRERSILELFADGLGTQDIAELLVLSRHTIRTHVRNALRTLGVHTREEAATIVRADQLAQLL
jgi:DNA-binding CsgD family transcriptional regulator